MTRHAPFRPRGRTILRILGALVVALGLAGSLQQAQAQAPAPAIAVATFAGGCFWCMEPPFDKLDGVRATISGYTGGHTANPTYEQVSAGGTGHAEVVRIEYDPAKIGYAKLLEVFWRNIDPLTANAQFCDHGDQYRPGIFVHDAEQRRLAEESKAALVASKRFSQPIVAEITDAPAFYAAEDYHQDFYQKNPLRYRYYRWACGRDERLAELWGAGE